RPPRPRCRSGHGLERTHVAASAGGLWARDAALIGRRARPAATARWPPIRRIDRGTARFERVRRRRSAVAEQWAEPRILIRDVAIRVADDAAAGRVPDEVVAVRGERVAEAPAVGRIAVGRGGAAREVTVAGDDRIPDGDRPDKVGDPAAPAGPRDTTGVRRDRDVAQVRHAVLVVGDPTAAAAALVAADGRVDAAP